MSAGGPGHPRRMLCRGAALLAAALCCPSPAAADAAVAALEAALAENQSYRNAMYLYLRVAGVAWITVEWVAAIALWRAWRLVRARVDDTHV